MFIDFSNISFKIRMQKLSKKLSSLIIEKKTWKSRIKRNINMETWKN